MKKYEQEAIRQVANFMLAAARTAPKARGIDNIVTDIISGEKLKRLIKKMKEIAKKEDKPSFLRDAQNLEKCKYVVLLGTKIKPIDLKFCGLCGWEDCDEAIKHDAVCSFNPLDLGIAVGSAVNVASNFHIDNRVMYSIGMTAMDLGYFSKDVKIAVGIPLSVTGKNIFFDRK